MFKNTMVMNGRPAWAVHPSRCDGDAFDARQKLYRRRAQKMHAARKKVHLALEQHDATHRRREKRQSPATIRATKAWQEVTIARKCGSLTQEQIDAEDSAICKAFEKKWAQSQQEQWLAARVQVSIAAYAARLAADAAARCVEAMLSKSVFSSAMIRGAKQNLAANYHNTIIRHAEQTTQKRSNPSAGRSDLGTFTLGAAAAVISVPGGINRSRSTLVEITNREPR
jgi:hypothetical protein